MNKSKATERSSGDSSPGKRELLYVSGGNIPSNITHTLQIVKMSEAFATQVAEFSLLTASDLPRLVRGNESVFRFYGVSRGFRIRRLVLSPYLPQSAFNRSNFPGFGHVARHYVRMHRPSVVYTRSHQTAEFAVKDGFQVIFETHDGGPEHPWTMDFISKCKGAQNLRGIVTTSEVLEQLFEDEGVSPRKLLVWPNGVDLERFRTDAGSRERARRELELPGDGAVVVYSGSLFAYKGIPTLLAAASLLPDVQFVLVGGEPGHVTRWAREARGLENLRFIGHVPNSDVPGYLAAADMFVVPNSKSDRTARWTFSLKLYEYLAARRPTIVSDIPSLRSFLADGANALFVPPDDPSALSRAIMRLRDDPELACRLADGGYALVQGYTWQRRASRILETFAPDLMIREQKR